MHDLALEIVEAHAVAVDDADLADAGRGKIENERRAEPAGADHQHARGFQLLLALAADLLQHQLALVAGDFLGGEHDGNLCHSAPSLPVKRATVRKRRRWHRGQRAGMTFGQPVEPKPPPPALRVAKRVDRDDLDMGDGAITSWAMRSPRRTRNGSLPWLIRITISSPR